MLCCACGCAWDTPGCSEVLGWVWDALRDVGSVLCLGQEHRSSVVFSALV